MLALGTVALADGACALDPQPGVVPGGRVELVAANRTEWPAAFDMWRIAEGHTFAELEAHIEAERERAEAGQPGLGHPGFVTGLISSGIVEAGSEEPMTGTVSSGTHAIVCMSHFEAVTDDPFRPFAVVGPIEVRE
jgi:hypothetical protein